MRISDWSTDVVSSDLTEAWCNALAGGLFILPFFIFSALAGQLADSRDKTWMIRLIKTAEIGIMVVGGVGIWLPNVPLMLPALFSMGMPSTFFGPNKNKTEERRVGE